MDIDENNFRVHNASMNKALELAVNHCGGQKALADQIEVSRQRLHAWLRKGIAIPPQYCVKIEAVTGTPRKKLRPDFPWGELK